jgi:hypothetical protein
MVTLPVISQWAPRPLFCHRSERVKSPRRDPKKLVAFRRSGCLLNFVWNKGRSCLDQGTGQGRRPNPLQSEARRFDPRVLTERRESTLRAITIQFSAFAAR